MKTYQKLNRSPLGAVRAEGFLREQMARGYHVTVNGRDVGCDEKDGYVRENPPIRIHTHCYKAPYLCPPYPPKTYETNGQYQYVTESLPLVPEPYGCTNLRITYFPRADLK